MVIVVEVNKTKDFVYWNRIGYVLQEKEDFEQEKRSGIINCLISRQKEMYAGFIQWIGVLTDANMKKWWKNFGKWKQKSNYNIYKKR